MGKRYEHVIWDWNGTLVDDVALCLDVINGLLQARALPPLDVSRYRRVFDFPVRAYYERIGFDFAKEAFEAVCNEFIEAYRAGWADCDLRPFAREAVAELTAAGVQQTVLSATERTMLQDQARLHGMHEQIQGWVGLDDTFARSKVDRGERWLQTQGGARERMVLVGDTLHDLEVAAALGIDCILVGGGHHCIDRLRDRSDAVCAELREVMEIL
jgi:phosphoglycolate phosphatase